MICSYVFIECRKTNILFWADNTTSSQMESNNGLKNETQIFLDRQRERRGWVLFNQCEVIEGISSTQFEHTMFVKRLKQNYHVWQNAAKSLSATTDFTESRIWSTNQCGKLFKPLSGSQDSHVPRNLLIEKVELIRASSTTLKYINSNSHWYRTHRQPNSECSN